MGHRILIVDDEKDIRDVLADLMRLGGDEIDVAENGTLALEMVRKRGPDLVLTDIRMPVMDGFELASKLAAFSPPIPYLFFSGFAGESDVKNYAGAPGFVGFVPKPVAVDKLLKIINRYFEQKSR